MTLKKFTAFKFKEKNYENYKRKIHYIKGIRKTKIY